MSYNKIIVNIRSLPHQQITAIPSDPEFEKNHDFFLNKKISDFLLKSYFFEFCINLLKKQFLRTNQHNSINAYY